MQSPIDQFSRFLKVACALDKTGNSYKFCHSLCLVTEAFVGERKP